MTRADKWVSDYANLPITAVGNLCLYDYRLLLRDAVIHRLSQTESGREYLEKCWMLEQTEPDRKRLGERFGK